MFALPTWPGGADNSRHQGEGRREEGGGRRGEAP